VIASSRRTRGELTALAELIHEKTAGIPFFSNALISLLFEEGLLTFDYVNGDGIGP